MLLQDRDGVCGAFSVANALIAMKIEVNVDEIKRVAGTTVRDGTSKRGIARAIRHYGLKATVYEGYSEESAWKWLLKWSSKCPVIVLIDNRQHYGTCIGRFGNQVILVDPSVPDDRYENNVRVLNKQEFLPEWRWGGRFYGIKVSRPVK